MLSTSPPVDCIIQRFVVNLVVLGLNEMMMTMMRLASGIEAGQSKHNIIELQLAEKKFGLKLNLDGVFRSLGFWLGPVLDAEEIAAVTKQAVEETPDYKSATAAADESLR